MKRAVSAEQKQDLDPESSIATKSELLSESMDFMANTKHVPWPTPDGIILTMDLKAARNHEHSHLVEVRNFLSQVDTRMARHPERVIQALVDAFPDSSEWLPEL